MKRYYLKIPFNPRLRSFLKNNWVLILFIFLHVIFFNINVAEWGDSYRILRASEFIRHFSYPSDEKRPPLYSLILAIHPGFIEQVFWGRLIMFFISLATFYIFKKLCDFLLPKKHVNTALIFFTLNPVFFYWSLRIMADVFFSLLVLVAIYIYLKSNGRLKISDLILIGFISGLSILTRFEGYILTGAIGLAILTSRQEKLLKNAFVFGISALITILPWLIYRNPLKSSYFDEPSGREYDLKMFFIYAVSILFIFGFTSAFSSMYKARKDIVRFLVKYRVISYFLGVELVLILLWPAAIPRLFVPIIPFLIILLIISIEDMKNRNVFISILLLAVFSISQYFLKLQFLVSMKIYFILVVILQAFIVFCRDEKRRLVLIFLSMFVWLLSSLFVHKDIFSSIKRGASYAAENLEGVVGYNDVSSISDWYLNQNGGENVSGVFFGYYKKNHLDCYHLHELGFDYILLTNEHNTDMSLDIESRSYLEVIKDFEYEINGKIFFTKVIRVNACEYLGYNL